MTLRSYVNMARQGQFGTHIILFYYIDTSVLLENIPDGLSVLTFFRSFSGVKTAIMP